MVDATDNLTITNTPDGLVLTRKPQLSWWFLFFVAIAVCDAGPLLAVDDKGAALLVAGILSYSMCMIVSGIDASVSIERNVVRKLRRKLVVNGGEGGMVLDDKVINERARAVYVCRLPNASKYPDIFKVYICIAGNVIDVEGTRRHMQALSLARQLAHQLDLKDHQPERALRPIMGPTLFVLIQILLHLGALTAFVVILFNWPRHQEEQLLWQLGVPGLAAPLVMIFLSHWMGRFMFRRSMVDWLKREFPLAFASEQVSA